MNRYKSQIQLAIDKRANEGTNKRDNKDFKSSYQPHTGVVAQVVRGSIPRISRNFSNCVDMFINYERQSLAS